MLFLSFSTTFTIYAFVYHMNVNKTGLGNQIVSTMWVYVMKQSYLRKVTNRIVLT